VDGRATHEVEHGRKLAARDPESAWGWGTPAGRLRADRRAALIVAGAGLRPGMRVLEIGCGTGGFTERFARSGAHLTAMDISGDLLALARTRGLPADRVTFVEGRFEDARCEGGFDAVIGSSILHHLDVPRALTRVFVLLKPGGRFSFAEPNMLNPQVFLERRSFFRSRLWFVSPDETAFVRWQLRRELEQRGFGDVRVTPFDFLHPVVPPALIPPVRTTGRILEALPGLREFAGSLHLCGTRPAIVSKE
jgi:SAM-dependent methyltransferase